MVAARPNGEFNTDEVERSKSVPPIETIVEHQGRVIDMPSRAQPDRTQVPNWIFPILATVLFGLLGFVYLTIEKEIDRIRQDLSTVQILMQHTREQLISHGWTIDAQGDIHPPEVNNAVRKR